MCCLGSYFEDSIHPKLQDTCVVQAVKLEEEAMKNLNLLDAEKNGRCLMNRTCSVQDFSSHCPI